MTGTLNFTNSYSMNQVSVLSKSYEKETLDLFIKLIFLHVDILNFKDRS
jgi:hypothetical protein